MNFSRFVQMRLQGANPDTPIANDIFGGTEPAGNTTTVQKSDPWSGVQPYMLDIFGRGQALSNSTTMAPQSPETLQAQQLQKQRALFGSPLTKAAQDQNLVTIEGKYLNPLSNPALMDTMDLAKSKINAQFQGDNFGNSAHQEWLGRGLMQAAAPFYESERNRQQQAMTVAPALAQTDYTDIGLLGQVGAAKDARQQQELEYPWQNLFNYQRAVAGSGATGGTSTSDQPYFTNPTANLMGTGLAAAGIYNLLGFSDRRLKREIRQVGMHPAGVPLYTFKYLWSDTPEIGVMADEVEKVKPEAVMSLGGLKMVNYSMLGA